MHDAYMEFGERETLAIAAAAEAQLGDIIHVDPTKEYAQGIPIPVEIVLNEDPTVVANCNVQFRIETDATDAFSGSEVTLATGPVVDADAADFVQGWKSSIKFLPSGNLGYLRVMAAVTTANLTSAVMSAYVPVGAGQANP